MGFDWIEDIGIGASIDSADIQEIRANVDTVDDEKCAADKVDYDSDYKDGDDSPHYPGYYSNQHGTYKNGDLLGYDSTYKPGYYAEQNTGYDDGDLVGVDSSHYTGALVSYRVPDQEVK